MTKGFKSLLPEFIFSYSAGHDVYRVAVHEYAKFPDETTYIWTVVTTYNTTWHRNPEHDPNFHHHKDLKSHNY